MQEEHRVLRKIFGPKRNQVQGAWRRLHNEHVCDLYCWPNIFQMNRNDMGGFFIFFTLIGDRRGACRVWWRDLRARRHLEDVGGKGITIL
jgi:hypothetical protein